MLSSALRPFGCWVGAGRGAGASLVRAEERGEREREREGGEAEEALTTLRL